MKKVFLALVLFFSVYLFVACCPYDGDNLSVDNSTEKESNYIKLFNIGSSMQDGAIYGDYLFHLDEFGSCKVYSMQTTKFISEFRLDKNDKIIPHSNSVCFSSEFFVDTDEFPLLYTNVYNNYEKSDDRLEGMCCVYRILRDADNFECELVQIIKIGFVENSELWKSKINDGGVCPFGNFLINTDSKKLYVFLMRDENNSTRFFEFDLPHVLDGEFDEKYGAKVFYLIENDILDQFDCSYFHFIQGCGYYNYKIYSIEGFMAESVYQPALRIIDLNSKSEILYINLTTLDLLGEPEFISIHNGVIYYGDTFGDLYLLKSITIPI